MKSLIAAIVLASSPVAYKAPPNRFDPSEMSSEAVFAGMYICFEQQGGFSPEKIPLCGCLMDAARLNLKKGKPNTTPTAEQHAQCRAPAPKPPPAKRPKGKTGV